MSIYTKPIVAEVGTDNIVGNRISESVDLIVIHAISEWIDTEMKDYHILNFLEKEGLAAHYFVWPDGTIIQQARPEQIVYHAKGFNNRSVGIEIVVPGLHTYSSFYKYIMREGWETVAQMYSTINLCNWLIEHCDMARAPDAIKGHNEIDPKRKDDPGHFSMNTLIKRVMSS